MIIKIHKSYISLFITAIIIVTFMVSIMRNQAKDQEIYSSGAIIKLGISQISPSKIQNASTGLQDMKISGLGFQGNNSSVQSASYNAFNNSQYLNIK